MASSVARLPAELVNWTERESRGQFLLDLKPTAKDLSCFAFSCEDSPSSACSDASDASPSFSARRQSSRIVDRWMETLARGMLSNTPRKSHEAEISVISSVAEPVSSRTAAFINRGGSSSSRSPTSEDRSSSARSLVEDIPSSARASYLIQRWRELESDAVQLQCPSARRREETDSILCSSCPPNKVTGGKELSEIEAIDQYSSNVEELESLLAKLREERQEELQRLIQERHVSDFCHRGWIQALIRFKHTNKGVGTAQQQSLESSNFELGGVSCERRKDSFEDRRRFPIYPRSPKSYPDTTEMHELLLRRPVFTLVSRGFNKKLDKIVLSTLRKQQSDGKDGILDQVSYPLLSKHSPSKCSDDAQDSCMTSRQSHLSPDQEMLHDLKDDVGKMRQEMAEMRKMLHHFFDEHSKFQSIITDRVSSSCFCSVGTSTQLYASVKEPDKKVLCSLCNESQIDAVLYKCGHMCSCYTCAQERRQANGKCPICSSLIADVIRVHPMTNFPS